MTAFTLLTSRESDFSYIPTFTPLERKILIRLARGMTNQRIAGDLCISVHTVYAYLNTIYSKIGVKKDREAIAWAWRHRIVDDDT